MFLSFLATAALFFSACGGSLQSVSNWGANPTGLTMNIYVPDRLAANPPVILNMDPCGGNAQQWFSGTNLPSFADQYGFIIIYLATTKDFNCWEVATEASLTHDGGGDSTGLAAMVEYTLQTYNADRSRVFAAGGSSGAMETNIVCGAYPDLFAAGCAVSGFPYGCRRGAGSSNPIYDTECPLSQVIKTPEQWLTELKRGYPGYTGSYPRMLIKFCMVPMTNPLFSPFTENK